jgi:hypothetical protein
LVLKAVQLLMPYLHEVVRDGQTWVPRFPKPNDRSVVGLE